MPCCNTIFSLKCKETRTPGPLLGSRPPALCLVPGPGPQPWPLICIYRLWPPICVYQPWPQICIYRPWPPIYVYRPWLQIFIYRPWSVRSLGLQIPTLSPQSVFTGLGLRFLLPCFEFAFTFLSVVVAVAAVLLAIVVIS